MIDCSKVDFIKKYFLAIVLLGLVFRILSKLVLNNSGVVLSGYIGPKTRHHFLRIFLISTVLGLDEMSSAF